MKRTTKAALSVATILLGMAATGCVDDRTVTTRCVKRDTKEIVRMGECRNDPEKDAFSVIYGGTVTYGTGPNAGRHYINGGTFELPADTYPVEVR